MANQFKGQLSAPFDVINDFSKNIFIHIKLNTFPSSSFLVIFKRQFYLFLSATKSHPPQILFCVHSIKCTKTY